MRQRGGVGPWAFSARGVRWCRPASCGESLGVSPALPKIRRDGPGQENHARTMVSVVAPLKLGSLVGCLRARAGVASDQHRKVDLMIALLLLLLILAVFGGLGFVVHALWFVLIAAVILWAIAFFMGSLGGGRTHGLR